MQSKDSNVIVQPDIEEIEPLGEDSPTTFWSWLLVVLGPSGRRNMTSPARSATSVAVAGRIPTITPELAGCRFDCRLGAAHRRAPDRSWPHAAVAQQGRTVIIILTRVGDSHADAVAKRLQERGVATVWSDSADFPAQAAATVAFTSSAGAGAPAARRGRSRSRGGRRHLVPASRGTCRAPRDRRSTGSYLCRGGERDVRRRRLGVAQVPHRAGAPVRRPPGATQGDPARNRRRPGVRTPAHPVYATTQTNSSPSSGSRTATRSPRRSARPPFALAYEVPDRHTEVVSKRDIGYVRTSCAPLPDHRPGLRPQTGRTAGHRCRPARLRGRNPFAGKQPLQHDSRRYQDGRTPYATHRLPDSLEAHASPW